MALKIVDVKLTSNYSWQNIKNQANWNAVRNTNQNWQQPLQTSLVGQQIKIEVEVSENNWLSIKDNHITWQKIKEKFTSWLGIKNY